MTIIKTPCQFAMPPSTSEVADCVGVMPIGSVVAWMPGWFVGLNTGYNQVLGASDDVGAANSYLIPFGWRVCDGGEPTDSVSPIWSAGRKVPNLTDKRFLQGSASIEVAAGEVDALNPLGNISGSLNTVRDHVHSIANIGGSGLSKTETGGSASHNHVLSVSVNNLSASHNHSTTGSITSWSSPSHTHSSTGASAVPWTSHTHNYGGNWNIDDSSQVSPVGTNGDGSGNTFNDQGGIYWGTGGTAFTTDTQGSHGHGILTTQTHSHDSYYHNHGSYARATSGAPLHSHGSTVILSDTISCSTASPPSHDYYMPSHRHWIGDRVTSSTAHSHSAPNTSSTGLSHSHPHTFAVSTENIAHNHAYTIATVAADISHSHSLTGYTGADLAPALTENRPQYLRCFMIIRFK